MGFVPSFVAKTQDPSSSDPRFEGFSVPAIPREGHDPEVRLLVQLVSGCSCPPVDPGTRSARTRSRTGSAGLSLVLMLRQVTWSPGLGHERLEA